MNVMVIDDDGACLRSIRAALQLNGFSVQCFDSAEFACAAYPSTSFDAVITDYHLPGLKGTQVLKDIRKHRADAPVLIISGDTEAYVETESLDAGATAFFRKPLDIEAIIECLISFAPKNNHLSTAG